MNTNGPHFKIIHFLIFWLGNGVKEICVLVETRLQILTFDLFLG
jgi:hypothetical protein